MCISQQLGSMDWMANWQTCMLISSFKLPDTLGGKTLVVSVKGPRLSLQALLTSL